jgi:type IV pilus assembly protein PilO
MSATATTIVKGAEEQGSFFTRLAWYYQMGVLLLLAALLTWAADYLLYSDTRAQTAKLQEETEALKKKNMEGSIIRQNLAATEQTLVQKREEIDRLRELLPDSLEISRVFDNVKDFLREQRLELKRFAHMKPVTSEFYTAQPIEVEVTGSYDNVGHFFSKLGFFTRIVSVTEVEIKTAEDNGQENGRSVNAQFIVTAYYIAPENLEKLTMKKPPAMPNAKGQPAKPETAQPKK